MKALILGGGFAGCTTAYLLKRAGWDVTLIEKEPHLGGGCRTFFYCGHPFTYGPRLYYGYSAKVFEWVNAVTPIRLFPFELKTLANEPVDADRKFWTFPPHEVDIPLYPRAAQVAKELAERDNSTEPTDFDEYYNQKVGPTIYDMLTKHHNRRCWMVESNKVFDTFRWSAKDNPIEKGSRHAYKGSFIGYPHALTGYNAYFEKMTEGVELILGQFAAMMHNGTGRYDIWTSNAKLSADVIVSTVPIDELFGHSLGEIPYAGRDFYLLLLPCQQILAGDVRWTHYAGENDEWTRVTEFKKVTNYQSPDTLLVLEKPSRNNKLYPFQTKAAQALVKQYMDALPPNVYSIGRLGTGKYSTIEQTIIQAFACAAKITGQPNEMEGEWRGIGDVSMMKDRKESA